MSNGKQVALPAGWAPSSLGSAPVAAQHGNECVCRNCAAQHYLKQLERANHLQHDNARLESEVKRLNFALAVERFRKLTLVIEKAVIDGDRETWAKACAERMGLGVTFEQVEAA